MNQYKAGLLKECVSGCNKDFDCPHEDINREKQSMVSAEEKEAQDKLKYQ